MPFIRFWKQRSLGAKILCGSLLMTLFTLITGIIAILLLNGALSWQRDLVSGSLPGVKCLLILREAQSSMVAVEERLLGMAEYSDVARSEQFEILDEARKRAYKAWNEYERLSHGGDEEKLWIELTDNWYRWKLAHENCVLGASTRTMANRKNVSLSRASGSSNRSYIVCREILDKLVSLRESPVDSAAVRLEREIKYARNILVGVICAATLLSLGCGMVMAHLISKPANVLADGAESLANWESCGIEHESTDELGQLADSLRTIEKKQQELIEGQHIQSEECFDGHAISS